MPPPRLYCPVLSSGSLTLSPEESHHAVNVLRLGKGARVVVFDGAGREAEAEVESADRRRLRVTAETVIEYPFDAPLRTTLAVAVPKAHRQGFLVEKCTELGVEAIWPLMSKFSVARTGAGGVERLRRRAIEAAKQSGRRWLPDVRAAMTFQQCCQLWSQFDCVALAHPGSPNGELCDILDGQPLPGRMLVMVGPEGGWSPEEIRQSRTNGARFIGLGDSVLRTETAALAVCAVIFLAANRADRSQPS
ncbi:MAG: 16S rRNA (uracil(1498)-N(3))-methyltransferase [Phycisphaerae bacterium]|nr:16S rRNA (uracil(1498)-N(3))-methyltransferase [Phycisphaerae bacterium]